MKISELMKQEKKDMTYSNALLNFEDGYKQALILLDLLESEGKVCVVPSVEEIEKSMQDTLPIKYEYQVLLTTSQFKLFAQNIHTNLLKGK